jgi:uncharacterized protein (TIGR02453 family)
MSFFKKDFHKFFQQLAKNNKRDWFHEHKKEYEEHVKKPFESFISSLILQSQNIDSEIQIMPKEAIFRIHRDVRFAKDKTPYKTNVSAIISKYGRKNMLHPGIYIQMGVDGLMIASGMYYPKPKDRDKVREHIMENLAEFKKIKTDKKLTKLWGDLQGDKNKVLPKVYKEFLSTEPLIANKAFYLMKRIDDPKIFLDEDLDQMILDHFKAARPLSDFLKKAIARQV